MKNFKRLYEADNNHPRRSHRPQAAQDDDVAERERAAEGMKRPRPQPLSRPAASLTKLPTPSRR
jgi:hypothetical protein